MGGFLLPRRDKNSVPAQKGALAFAPIKRYKISLNYFCETGDLPSVIKPESPSSIRAAFTSALYMQG